MLAISQLVNRWITWLYAHSPTQNRYLLAAAVVLATCLAERLIGRVMRWVVAAAIAFVGGLMAYRLLAG